MPTAEITSAHARLDRRQAELRDILFDFGLSGTDALIGRLESPDAAIWLRGQSDEALKLVAMLADVTATRLHLEILDGVLDGDYR